MAQFQNDPEKSKLVKRAKKKTESIYPILDSDLIVKTKIRIQEDIDIGAFNGKAIIFTNMFSSEWRHSLRNTEGMLIVPRYEA